ncbi:MAG: hypothetical protein ACOX52_23225 [Verrucomicrobiota bacterium]
MPTRTGFDSDPDSDNDLTDRQPLPEVAQKGTFLFGRALCRKFSKKEGIRGMALTHPHNQVGNATAPSAGGLLDPDGRKAAGYRFNLFERALAIGLVFEWTRIGGSDTRNRVAQPYCCGADKTRQ